MVFTVKRRLGPVWLLCVAAMAIGCGDGDDPLDGRMASVVFDIDGTLTPCASCFLSVRPDAARAVEAYVDKGYAVIYMTARPWLVEGFTRACLQGAGFPDLPLYLADALLVGEEQTAEYKQRVLTELTEEEDRTFLYAYGDSTSDFTAYNRAGIPEDQTFALLRLGDTVCQEGVYEACLPGYEEHLDYIETQPDVD